MLLRFWVENYWCFRDRVEIDFTDKRNYSFGKDCVRGDLLEKVIITGSNGAGKTSFGYALVDITSTLTGFTRDIGQANELCFINGDSGRDRATFHYEFSHRGSVVTYEYSKTSPYRIAREALYIDRAVAFEYDLDDMGSAVFDAKAMGLRSVDPGAIDGETAFLRSLCAAANPGEYSPLRTVMSFGESTLYYRAMWRMDDHIGQIDADMDVSGYVISNGLVDDLQAFLRDDCGIDVRVGAEGGRLVVLTGSKSIPFFQAASRGTAIMCRLFVWTRRTRGRDALIFFDDFDDMFDYRAAENVMGRIIEGSSLQCVFATHNLGLISSDRMRPDCCFLMNNYQLRSLSSLTDKNLRRGHNLSKMLRDGEFSQDGS